MKKSSISVLLSMAALMLATAFQPIAQQDKVAAQADCQTFKETGKTVCGRFLTYWKEHGGLMQQGYPISSELKEVSDVDGKPYTMQYFERAVFELHPENKPPHDVLLSLLGTMFYKQKYPNGAQELPPDTRADAGLYFKETGKSVRGLFLDYWQKNGGLAQQGYPLTNLVREKSELDGKEYVVQYFERAVFELHPENPPPHNVLLSQLGTMQHKRKYGNAGPQPGKPLQTGVWGGDHVIMQVTDKGATLEFDCAHGTITQPMTADANGNVNVTGVFVFEKGGPTPANAQEDTHPARYTGKFDGTTLTLTITLTDQNKVVSTYKLEYGKQGRLVKCL